MTVSIAGVSLGSVLENSFWAASLADWDERTPSWTVWSGPVRRSLARFRHGAESQERHQKIARAVLCTEQVNNGGVRK